MSREMSAVTCQGREVTSVVSLVLGHALDFASIPAGSSTRCIPERRLKIQRSIMEESSSCWSVLLDITAKQCFKDHPFHLEVTHSELESFSTLCSLHMHHAVICSSSLTSDEYEEVGKSMMIQSERK